VQTMSRAERERDSISRPSTISSPSRSNTPYYPSISRSEPVSYDSQPTKLPNENRVPPIRPPRPDLAGRSSYREFPTQIPEQPPREPLQTLFDPEPSQTGPDRPPKVVDEVHSPPAKKQRLMFKPSAYLENGEPIRSLFLPSGLREHFLRLAAENTQRGLEMCGILCGTAVNNALFVKCLVIPEQKCGPDTCETENENALFDYCMSEDLLQLGWIHTHPTQSCFMSSRDLHTQAGYQVMLPESIAVVCAPKYEPS
jgi:STAM-binding protein